MGDSRDSGGKPIAYVSGIDPARDPGGHPSYVKAHALAAQASGFSPHIFCASARSELELTDYGTLHRVATPARHFLVGPAHPKPIARAVADLLAGSGHPPPQLVHGFGVWANTAVEASAELVRRGVPSIAVSSAYTMVVHEWKGILRELRHHPSAAALWYWRWYPWVRTGLARTERRGYRRSGLVLVNYDSVAELLVRAVGAGLRIRRIPYAAPAAFGSRPPTRHPDPPDLLGELSPAAAPLVISVSRHTPRKGLGVLIRALSALRSEGLSFRAALIGPGRLLDEHRALARGLGLADTTALPGYVPDVLPYLQQADIFVLASLEEGSGSVALLEALQAGCAIVASSCDGVPEDIVDGEHGLLVAPGDELALRAALGRMIVDAGLRARLGAAAHRRYNERFSAQRFAAALRDVYAELGVRP